MKQCKMLPCNINLIKGGKESILQLHNYGIIHSKTIILYNTSLINLTYMVKLTETSTVI